MKKYVLFTLALSLLALSIPAMIIAEAKADELVLADTEIEDVFDALSDAEPTNDNEEEYSVNAYTDDIDEVSDLVYTEDHIIYLYQYTIPDELASVYEDPQVIQIMEMRKILHGKLLQNYKLDDVELINCSVSELAEIVESLDVTNNSITSASGTEYYYASNWDSVPLININSIISVRGEEVPLTEMFEKFYDDSNVTITGAKRYTVTIKME